jgi:hypothetical protein
MKVIWDVVGAARALLYNRGILIKKKKRRDSTTGGTRLLYHHAADAH